MNATPLTNIAPDIFRKRLLVEGYFEVEITEDALKKEELTRSEAERQKTATGTPNRLARIGFI